MSLNIVFKDIYLSSRVIILIFHILVHSFDGDFRDCQFKIAYDFAALDKSLIL